MKKLGLLAAGIVAISSLATAPAIQASGGDYCSSNGEVALGVIQLGDGNTGTLYVDDRNYLFGHGFWIYAESNGVTGLQRGGESALGADLGGRDSCVEGAGPYDTIIF